MRTKRDVLMVLVALAAGVSGSMISSLLLISTPVFAQKAPQREKVRQAEQFQVVDEAGKIRAIFGVVPDGTLSLVLNDNAGRPLLSHRMWDSASQYQNAGMGPTDARREAEKEWLLMEHEEMEEE